MMAEHIETGKSGEDAAADYLVRHGMKIIERNWRMGHKEVDIIALDGNEIVFVEVKTRKTAPQKPSDVMGDKKMSNLINAASVFIKTRHVNLECRFDLVVIWGEPGAYEINHIARAFRPYLR